MLIHIVFLIVFLMFVFSQAGEARKVLPYIVMELLQEKSEKETFKLISNMDMMVLNPKEIGFRLINSNSSQVSFSKS